MRKTYFNCVGLVYLIVVATIIISFNTKSFAQCDAQILDALRTRYQGATSQTVKDFLYEASCKLNFKDNNPRLNIVNPEYGSFSYDNRQISLSEACYTNVSDYFSNYTNNTIYSFMPDSAIPAVERCLGGFSLTAKRRGNVLTIRAAYVPKGINIPATVDSFDVSPSTAVTCANPFKNGDEIHAGGKSINCIITNNEDVTVLLNTTDVESPAPVTVSKMAEISNYFGWTLEKTGATFKCKDGEGKIYEPAVSMASVGNSDVAAIGSCITRNGKGFVKINEQRFVQKDAWSNQTYSGKPYYNCKLNGKIIGDLLYCNQTVGCNSSVNYTNYCAGWYGHQQVQ